MLFTSAEAMRGKPSPTKAFGAKGVTASVAKKAVKNSTPAPKRPTSARPSGARAAVAAPARKVATKAAPVVATRSARAGKHVAAAAPPARINHHNDVPRRTLESP